MHVGSKPKNALTQFSLCKPQDWNLYGSDYVSKEDNEIVLVIGKYGNYAFDTEKKSFKAARSVDEYVRWLNLKKTCYYYNGNSIIPKDSAAEVDMVLASEYGLKKMVYTDITRIEVIANGYFAPTYSTALYNKAGTCVISASSIADTNIEALELIKNNTIGWKAIAVNEVEVAYFRTENDGKKFVLDLIAKDDTVELCVIIRCEEKFGVIGRAVKVNIT